MPVTIVLPPTLRALAADTARIEVQATTVREALAALHRVHPGVMARVCDATGNPRRFVEIYKDADDIRFLDNLDTTVEPNAVVRIVGPDAGSTR